MKIFIYQAEDFTKEIREILASCQDRILCFLDPSVDPSPVWIEQIFYAHKKYKNDPLIQGRTVYMPQDNVSNIVSRFNNQSLIRNTMKGNKAMFWKWISGQVKNDFYVQFLDKRNFSIKLKDFNRNNIIQNIFTSEAYYQKTLPLLVPSITVFDSSKYNLIDKFYQPLFVLGKSNHSSMNTIKRLAALIMFCLKNKYFLKLPNVIKTYIYLEISDILANETKYKPGSHLSHRKVTRYDIV